MTYWRRRWQRQLRGLALILGSGGWLWWLAWRLAWRVARSAPTFARADVIVVPGYRLRDDEIPRPYELRLARALRLYRSGSLLLISGTAAGPASQSEALAGFTALRDLGLPADAPVLLETQARDSEENLRAAALMLGAPAGGVVVVSNRWHLARLAALLWRLGLNWKVCAAERRWRPGLFAHAALAREAFSLVCFLGLELTRLDVHRLLEPRT